MSNRDPSEADAEASVEAGVREADHVVELESEGGRHYFDPVGLHVRPGETVAFVVERGTHTATAYHAENDAPETRIPADAEPWDTDDLLGDESTYVQEFTAQGTHDFFCRHHRTAGMVGRIVVGEPGGPAEERAIPDGGVPDSATIVERGAVSYEEFAGR